MALVEPIQSWSMAVKMALTSDSQMQVHTATESTSPIILNIQATMHGLYQEETEEHFRCLSA